MSPLTFTERKSCVSCGANRSTAVWSATYDNGAVSRFMDRYGYAVDWSPELGKKPISLLCCTNCSMLYHEHILDEESLERLYSDWIDENQINTLTDDLEDVNSPAAKFRDAADNVRHLVRLNRLIAASGYDPSRPWRVLDFGCGAAEFLKQASLFGFETWGVDFSTTRAAQALNQQISIISSLREFNDVATEPVHAVTMFQVLEHLDDPRRTLFELADVLVDDGILIIEVPDCSNVTVPRTFEEFRNVHPLEHINAFTPETLTALVQSTGFTKINPGPAHVTDRPEALVRSELTRFYEPKRTNQYFRKGSPTSL